MTQMNKKNFPESVQIFTMNRQEIEIEIALTITA